MWILERNNTNIIIWSVNQNSINGQLWTVNTKTSIQQKNLICMTKDQEMECKNCTSNNLEPRTKKFLKNSKKRSNKYKCWQLFAITTSK